MDESLLKIVNVASQREDGESPFVLYTPLPASWVDEAEYAREMEHARYHESLTEQVETLLAFHASQIELDPPYWSLKARVRCPDALPVCEGQVLFDEEIWFALIEVRCDLSPELLEWVLVHELFEVDEWRSATSFFDALSHVYAVNWRRQVKERFLRGRNQDIERKVGRYLGRKRPDHLFLQEGEKKR